MNRKIAMVTGAAHGIGKAIAARLLTDGFFVIAVDIDAQQGDELASRSGKDKLAFFKADICNAAEVKNLFDHIKEEYKALYLLVNNAGIIRDNLIWNMPEDDFDRVIDVNLKGTWMMCKHAAEWMRIQQSGRIVNISSRAMLGNRGQSNYSASKAGVVALTRVLALELGRYNVLVNAVAPGLIDTPLTRSLDEKVLKQLIDAQPTREMGKPEDIANVVSFLASESTRFITGQTIYVDGGKSIGAGF